MAAHHIASAPHSMTGLQVTCDDEKLNIAVGPAGSIAAAVPQCLVSPLFRVSGGDQGVLGQAL
jgi:hypothetical protein